MSTLYYFRKIKNACQVGEHVHFLQVSRFLGFGELITTYIYICIYIGLNYIVLQTELELTEKKIKTSN